MANPADASEASNGLGVYVPEHLIAYVDGDKKGPARSIFGRDSRLGGVGKHQQFALRLPFLAGHEHIDLHLTILPLRILRRRDDTAIDHINGGLSYPGKLPACRADALPISCPGCQWSITACPPQLVPGLTLAPFR